MSELSVLGLQLPTDPRWVAIAKKSIEEILVDHAYCEQKAASSCISLIVQFPEKEKLVEILTPVVAEEWGHFTAVLQQLKKRGYKLGKQRTDEYVVALSKLIKKGGSREEQLMDKLLVNALIEARSCERFKLLSQKIQDRSLQDFYHTLMISEAGHYKNFIKLAKTYMPAPKVASHWEELLKAEAQLIKNLSLRPGRMH